MIQSARLELPDGRQLDYQIRASAKARHLRLKMTVRDGLTVIAPAGLNHDRVVALVAKKTDWITAQLKQFDQVRHLLGETTPVRPQAFDLPALAESWRVEYRRTKGKTVAARTDRPGRIVVSGPVDDDERCKTALRRWLARRARETLEPWLTALAADTGLTFERVTIRSQRTRWGSCSPDGTISLNCKLLFLPRELVRYVLIHELCHTRELNHGSGFWSHLRQLEPATDALHGRMRDAWKLVPGWVHPIRTSREGEIQFW